MHFTPKSNYGAGPEEKSSPTLKTRKSVERGKTYIKKPLNAFMLYAKEQRPFVKMIYADKDSGTVNKLLGQMWQALQVSEKAVYFEEAQRLEREHVIKYPNWSAKDNYGKSKRTKRSNAASCTSHHPTATLVAAYPVTATPAGAFPIAAYPVAGYPVAGYPVAAYPVAGYPVAGYPVAGYPVAGYPAAASPGAASPGAAYPAAAYSAAAFAVAADHVSAPVTNSPPSSSDLETELPMPPSLEEELSDFLEDLANQPQDQWPDFHFDASLFDL
ncbi:transcription factor 7-like 1-B [Corythoichthys intestinalis]|uniref:transcription factor 7-like 1-B n=1 Tax=Corythoichthys intestinalis TaxID=161448 RepID=UPI0025A5ABD1|nr:transcription factor 7-like 1-B [Corythoichthys intestinalis]